MRVLYFAWVREQVGVAEEEVSPPAEVASVAALVDWLARRSPAHEEAFRDRSRLRAAVDQSLVGFDAAIDGAREIAIFPPATGG